MSPRLRIAASVIALAAAWWLGMLAERSRSGAPGREAETGAGAHYLGTADATARQDAARAAEMRAAREAADVFTHPTPAPPRDLAASIAAARQAPSDVQRVRRMIIATGDLTAEEIPAALALAMRPGTDKEEKGILRLAVLARWAELDPPAAAAYATQVPGAADNMEGEILKTVVGEWGVRDPAAAADFVANLDDEKRGKAVAGLLAGVAASQPETALALLARFPEAAKDSASYLAIFGAWSDRDPRGAAARAAALPPGDFRARALAGVTERWAGRDPAAAYAWATQLGDPAEREAAFKTTLHSARAAHVPVNVSILKFFPSTWVSPPSAAGATRTTAATAATAAKGSQCSFVVRIDVPSVRVSFSGSDGARKRKGSAARGRDARAEDTPGDGLRRASFT